MQLQRRVALLPQLKMMVVLAGVHRRRPRVRPPAGSLEGSDGSVEVILRHQQIKIDAGAQRAFWIEPLSQQRSLESHHGQTGTAEDVTQFVERRHEMCVPDAGYGVITGGLVTNLWRHADTCTVTFVNQQREDTVLASVLGKAIPFARPVERLNETRRIVGRAREYALEPRRYLHPARGHRGLG